MFLGVKVMSRVEKYREYRDEISHLPEQPKETKKRQSSQRVQKILEEKNDETKLAFEDVYDGLDIYNVSTQSKTKHLSYKTRRLIIFYSVMCLVIIGLLIGVIIVGKNM